MGSDSDRSAKHDRRRGRFAKTFSLPLFLATLVEVGFAEIARSAVTIISGAAGHSTFNLPIIEQSEVIPKGVPVVAEEDRARQAAWFHGAIRASGSVAILTRGKVRSFRQPIPQGTACHRNTCNARFGTAFSGRTWRSSASICPRRN